MNNSDYLKLPVIKGKLPGAKHLSMDAYFSFVLFNLKYTMNKKYSRKLKKSLGVNKVFFI